MLLAHAFTVHNIEAICADQARDEAPITSAFYPGFPTQTLDFYPRYFSVIRMCPVGVQFSIASPLLS
jgi:hypothetical protein